MFTEADTGNIGVELVKSSLIIPDCIILDYNLPDMDAIDVLGGLTHPNGLPVCPVVVLTGGTGPEASRLVLRAGAQDYIAKEGLTPHALTRIIENAVERLAMARERLDQNAALLRTEKILSDADKRKDEFIATLAHELRNPLAPIFTGLQVLRLTKDAEMAKRTMGIMERQLRQMTQLIDDLMDISRITTGKLLLRIERVLISTVVEAAVESARSLILAGKHTLVIDLSPQPIWLDVDQTRLAQIIGNLLNNSAKYSGEGAVITLSAHQCDGDVVIEVSDTGMGIPADMLDQVFDMFTQVNRTLRRAQGGLGIGLALVKQLVEMHGGTVVAKSEGAGLGSSFFITIPLNESARTVQCNVADKPPSSNISRRILIVDDKEDNAKMLALMLALSGHTTCTAFNGEDALKQGAVFDPEIVFLDIGLPGMTGYEVAERFRLLPGQSDIFLVALTGWGGEEDRRKSKAAGFNLHVTKPVESTTINAAITQFETSIQTGISVK